MQVLLRALRKRMPEQPLITNKAYCLFKHIYWANGSAEYKGYCEGWSGVDSLFAFID